MNRHRAPLFLVAGLAAVALLAGCGGGDSASPTSTVATGDAGRSMLPNSGMTLADALGLGGTDPVLVRAYLIVDADGTARLCDDVRESRPPQCGGASVVATDLPPGLIEGLESAGGVRWSNGPVQLIGTIRDEVFVNDPAALAAS